MKRLLISLIASMAILPVFAQMDKEITRKTYSLNVGQFDRLCVSDNVNVEYRCVPDSTGFVRYEGEPEFANAFIFSNNKGKLHIQVNTEDVDSPNLPVLKIYSDYLVSVENSSDFTVTVWGDNAVPAFEAKQIGNGKIVATGIRANDVTAIIATGNGQVTLTGSCSRATYRMLGTGVIQADGMRADQVTCRLLGSGNIYCDAKYQLNVKGIGSTKIFYKGDPKIKKVGGGKVFPLAE